MGNRLFRFAGFHCAQRVGLVNEHVDIAYKNEKPRKSALGLHRAFERKCWTARIRTQVSVFRPRCYCPRKRSGIHMALKSTLSAMNLEALGAERLAQLLIEICTGDAAAKRKLRLALAGAEGPKEARGRSRSG